MERVSCKIRMRDLLVGVTTCLAFEIATHFSVQHQILAALASINLGFVAALASAHLWSPGITPEDTPPSELRRQGT